MRKIFASREMEKTAKLSPNKKVEVYSFFPCDKADCECASLILEWKTKLSAMNPKQRQEEMGKQGYLTCPRSKVGLKRFIVSCKRCGEVLGYCWAKDSTLKDWCDFHYVQWTDGKEWHGCLTPNVSPVTEQLTLECCCGEDTRDFRANMTLSSAKALELESINSIGREFGSKISKFLVSVIGKNVLPFNI